MNRFSLLLVLIVAGVIRAWPFAQVLPSPQGQAETKCMLSGRVTNALTGEPIRKSLLKLVPTEGSSAGASPVVPNPEGNRVQAKAAYTATSDSNGSFQFESIEPGPYRLSASRFAFLPAHYGSKGTTQPGSILNLVAGQKMTDISVSQIPQAVISGKSWMTKAIR